MKKRLNKAEDAQRRVDAATRDFHALLNRHGVKYMVEQGQNSLTGQFMRVAFYVDLSEQVPKKDPVTNS